jgi:hypothetical protein
VSRSDDIEAKLDHLIEQGNWVVAALKHLLQVEAGIEPEEDEDDWLDDDLSAVDTSQFEHTAVRSKPQPKAPVCTHNHQVLVDGNVQCARCGTVLNSGGLVRSSVSPSGQVVADPNPPRWALEHSPGASSKNPGTPLVPHSVN